MKRIQEKVKDLIEVRAYKSLQDFISEPSQTLAIYHFTDFTSDLMAKYLDKITNVRGGSGAAAALAGYRGVGKSHFLATVGALVSHPELRARVADSHVAASLQRLKRARYPAAFVRRGSYPTLIEELKNAIAKAFETQSVKLGDSVEELLSFAAEKSGETTFVLIVDTAFERVSRVARDDGAILGEIAEQAKKLGMFVAVALDDDIADADGINAAIARSFTIDYLDQEHLYRIVDTHLFPKNRQMLPTLHEIYTNFREILPDFRWSEQRFSALYPLHPIILEIAPFVRLYAPEFALLGFAADAGGKILSRPANSLIGLDEVFDSVESMLRKSTDLREAFVVYDNISKNFIAQISIMQRLQAKLVLKALFLLSLEGTGANAAEISAAMLIYDESESGKTHQSIESLLEGFASAFPAEIARTADTAGKSARYVLKVDDKENLTNALAEAIKNLSSSAIPKILRRAARERFADWTFTDEETGQNTDSMRFTVVWRGSQRRGRLSWQLGSKPAEPTNSADSESLDWEVIIGRQPENARDAENETVKIYWQPASLKKDEAETILRHYVLLSDKNLREQFGEQIRAASHSHVLSVEKIWNRIFLTDAGIFIDGVDYEMNTGARSAASVKEMLSMLLEPVFEARYPNHPYFTKTLGQHEVSQLVGDFFGGARQNLKESQELAEIFALPLGLVALNQNLYALETESHLANLVLTEEILKLVNRKENEIVSLKTIYPLLKKVPFGLTIEAQHLILTALVAQRRVEFVTSHGDRINRRSLDLKIIWDDIEGIAKPSGIIYTNERLTEWARILTDSANIGSIDTDEERSLIYQSLDEWLTDWQTTAIVRRFEALSDETLNTKIWRTAANVEKNFGSIAETVSRILDRSISLEEGLHRVAAVFSNSEKEFFAAAKDLVVLEDFTNGVATRAKIENYLILCENTGDEKIEADRQRLLQIVEKSRRNPNEKINREMEQLQRLFIENFSGYFSGKHDSVMKSNDLQAKFDEIMHSERWWEFSTLSETSVFTKKFRDAAQAICRRFHEFPCRFDTAEMLKRRPFCGCSFNLTGIPDWENLPAALEQIIEAGRRHYRQTLRPLESVLTPAIDRLAENNPDDQEMTEAARHLNKILKSDDTETLLTNNELIILLKALEMSPLSEIQHLPTPDSAARNTRISAEKLEELVNF